MSEKKYPDFILSGKLTGFSHYVLSLTNKEKKPVKGIFIPFDENGLNQHENGNVYFEAAFFKLDDDVKIKDYTHKAVISFPQEIKQKLIDQKKYPDLGLFKPFTKKSGGAESANVSEDFAPMPEENLPF